MMMFRLGRALCVLGDWLSWPGDRLYAIGDSICFRALYSDAPDETCPDCGGEAYGWATDGWNFWTVPCGRCAANLK